MSISKISVKRPITTLMGVVIIILIGLVSLNDLSIDLLPNINVPVAIVATDYENVAPGEIEKLVTKPIERAIATTPNIKSVKSTNYEGKSVIVAEFNSSTDMNFATLNMREKIDIVKGALPEGVKNPMVLKVDPNAQPIMMLSVTGYKNLSKLQNFIEDNIQNEIERLEGVASVKISGGVKDEVTIVLKQDVLDGYNLSTSYIANILRGENLNLPSGEVKRGKNEVLIRTIGEFKSLKDIKNIQIPLKDRISIPLDAIATISKMPKKQELMSLENGKQCVSLSIQKQSDSNIVEVATRINKKIEKLKVKYPNIKIKTLFDQSEYVNKSISNVKSSAIIGAILAVLVLLVFLKNIRSTFIIGTSIPISIIATFVLLYFGKITLNIMTLGGLALGVGMLVDNSIVVLENIYRFIGEGYTRRDAAINGAKEVSASVIASTLTTVAVFLPIAFTTGVTGDMFKDLAITVVFSLTASLVVALTFIPMLASVLLNESKIVNKSELSSQKHKFSLYKKLLNWSLENRVKTIIFTIGIFIVSIMSLKYVGAEFFPDTDQGNFNINIQLPDGSNIDDTKNVVSKIQKLSKKIPEIDTVFSEIGGSSNSSVSGSEKNKAQITVNLKPIRDRDRNIKDIMDQLRELSSNISGCKINFSSGFTMRGISKDPIVITIKGEDLDKLEMLGEKIKNIVKSVEGTREVKSDLKQGKAECRIKIDRDIKGKFGISTAEIASQIKGLVSGVKATTFKTNNDEIDIVVKGEEKCSESIASLQNIKLQGKDGNKIPLNLVATIELKNGPSAIKRENQGRVATVTGKIYGRDLKSISNEIDEKLKKVNMPEGYSYEMGGDSEEMIKAFKELIRALIIAVILVYMVMAAQFESLINPFVIMFSVPLAFAGGALGLFITRRTLCVPAFIGVIILSGIVVNNAIVLIDYINIRRKNGENRKTAILNAGTKRVRPILMTASTTILGLIPMSFELGDGAEVQSPMATVVIGGLIFSTILTLVFIPVLYTVFEDIKNKFTRKPSNSATKIGA